MKKNSMRQILDIGMIVPIGITNKKVRFGLYECPSCKIIVKIRTASVKRGNTTQCKRCRNKKPLWGVGINDVNYDINKHNTMCPYYAKWSGMIKRVYQEPRKEKNMSYENTTVCDEWLTFSNFKIWMQGHDWEGKQIDKDILFPNNDTYAPDVCCFVSSELNSMFTTIGSGLIGTSYHKHRKKFQASINIHGKQKYLGLYDTALDARKTYIVAKIAHIETFFSEVTPNIKKGLKKHIKILKKELYQ